MSVVIESRRVGEDSSVACRGRARILFVRGRKKNDAQRDKNMKKFSGSGADRPTPSQRPALTIYGEKCTVQIVHIPAVLPSFSAS